jgi:hypothetical protein
MLILIGLDNCWKKFRNGYRCDAVLFIAHLVFSAMDGDFVPITL